MPSRRATALVGVVVAIAVVQIFVEDVLLFFGATGATGPTILSSPVVLIGVPFVLFLALAGILLGWAILESKSLR